MNPTALGWMIAILVAGLALGFEAFRLGAWAGLGLYILALVVLVNPRFWWPSRRRLSR
ncbi:hypothetical protein [Methylobacterium sp. yr668]|uniref:hypothetical protein n=1 Tax=Methylobacterium sp. yr668 TaxID=1761801 RepID=UPI0015870545|nr:hypothetical protein [Methylobacterium sp. yr668]